MKIIIDFLGTHTELTDGFAWCFIGICSIAELLLAAIVLEIIKRVNP